MKKLPFNHWQAYLILAQGYKEKFILYCDSCNFTIEEVNEIINEVN